MVAVHRWAAACLVAAGLAMGAPASAQGPIFQWVDARGNLHLSDELADVPEPYRSMYEARLREAAEARKRNGEAPAARAPVAPPPPSVEYDHEPSIIDQQAANRQRWKQEVATWRAELAAATAELAQADAQLGDLEMNPVLAQTPSVAADIVQARQARAAALARVERARRTLLTELPARARRDGVPPAWLL